MLKVLTTMLAVLIPLAGHAAPADPRGEWRPFPQEVVFEADVIDMEGPLSFWLQPKEADIETAQGLMNEIRSPYVIQDPYLFKIQLAGLSTGVSSGMLLSEDGFENEARAASLNEMLNHQYQFRCYGKYADLQMPICSAIDPQGKSAGVNLIRQGIYMRDKHFKALSSLEIAMMKDAQKAAEADAIGIWKPFRFMLRGLQ